MKINKIIYVLIFITCMSCNKNFLNPVNPDGVASDAVWKDASLVEMVVNGMYNDQIGWDRNLYLATVGATDESRTNYPNETPWGILRGDFDATNNPMDVWAKVYTSIRKANEFLANIDAATIDNATKTRLKGEVQFLRALEYFNLVKRYGGVPIITKPQGLNDSLQVSRNSISECMDFIMKELDLANGELPATVVRGKAGKGAALALKGEALLFYASPLYNEKNDANLWNLAAQANKAVMDLNQYALYPDLTQLWQDMSSNNKEPIFEIQYALPQKYHGWDAMVTPLVIANGDAGHISPLQELINAFPMANGSNILETGSGYDPDNPYAGRDNRFYSFIGYNGAKRKGMLGGKLTEITFLLYKGGRDFDSVPSAQVYNTITGYNTMKMVNQNNTIYNYGYGSVQPWIELSYSEVLLNYAEAQNEYLGVPDASVYDAVNGVRKRAGIVTLIPVGSLSKAKMRDLVHNERYVEFCFQNKRYWDLRRWKLAETTLNGKKFTGVVITKRADNSFTYSYQSVDPQPVVFSAKMNFMPIPFSELSKDKNLIQNPGW